MTLAGESGSVSAAIGTEDATAPETLRFKDRKKMTLWKAMLPFAVSTDGRNFDS